MRSKNVEFLFTKILPSYNLLFSDCADLIPTFSMPQRDHPDRFRRVRAASRRRWYYTIHLSHSRQARGDIFTPSPRCSSSCPPRWPLRKSKLRSAAAARKCAASSLPIGQRNAWWRQPKRPLRVAFAFVISHESRMGTQPVETGLSPAGIRPSTLAVSYGIRLG